MKRAWGEEERKAADDLLAKWAPEIQEKLDLDLRNVPEEILAFMAVELQCEVTYLAEQVKEARGLLRELYALVRGESPALLNEDSGGDGRLSLAIETFCNPEEEA